MSAIGVSTNEYGTLVSVHRCDVCGEEFTVCPPVDDERWGGVCLSWVCDSYDVTRDAELMIDRWERDD